MLKKIITAFAALALLALFAGCTTFRADGLAYMSSTSGMEVLGHFEESTTVYEFLGTPGGENLFNITAEAMKDKADEIITREITKQGGDAAINVQIVYKAGFLNYLLNWLTWDIVAPAKLYVKGDVVKLSNKAQANLLTEESLSNAVSFAMENLPVTDLQ